MGALGKPKDPGSGRKAGTPNKDTQDLMAICNKHNCNVFEGMVMLAVAEVNKDKKFDRLCKIAEYLYPKRKSIEHSGELEGIRVILEDYSSKDKA